MTWPDNSRPPSVVAASVFGGLQLARKKIGNSESEKREKVKRATLVNSIDIGDGGGGRCHHLVIMNK